MSVHEQFAEDLALHALGTLQGDERLALDKHLQECQGCRRELELLRGDMALMALATGGPKPPARSRQRLVDAIAAEPRPVRVPRSRPWWALVPSFAALALGVVAVFFWQQNLQLQQQAVDLRDQAAQRQSELQRVREVVSTLTASDAMRVTLVAARTPPQPQGKAIYVRDRSSLIFLASNMPPVPAQKAYELWLIPIQGAPIPAGMFKPDAHGSATVVNPPLPAGVEAKAFAITLEPEAGSTAPTSSILMIGAGE